MSDKRIRIKNIGNDNAPMRFIKLDNESTVSTDELALGEINSFKEFDESINVCLAPLKQTVVEVTPADSDILGEMILAGIVDTKYASAESFIINEVTSELETTVDVLFTSRLNNQITGNVERKQHYFLKLGNTTDLGISTMADFSIMATTFDAGNGDVIGTPNTVLPKNKVFVTSTNDIIYPMVISELDPNTYTDLVIDLDGTRTLFAPTFHKLNINITVENNGEISPVNVRGFDATFETETGNYDFSQKKEANSFSIGNNTSLIDDEIKKSIGTLFQYKLDDSVILEQSFAIEFEHWLIDEAAEMSMTVGSTVYNKAGIIANSVLVNNKYYFILTVNNKNTTGTMVEVNADYDGSTYKDFVKTHYQFIFASTITPPPAFPMFALSSRVARVEVKNENTYFYEGMRYLQFKVPVTEPALVGIFPVVGATNYGIKNISTPTTLTAISGKEALADFLHLKLTDTLMQYDETKPNMFGFEKAGEAIFQVAVPIGVTGQIYFTLKPVGGNGNLLQYDDELMQLRGIIDRLPPPVYQGNAIISNSYALIEDSTPLLGQYLFTEPLMPGQAIAWDSLFINDYNRITLADERITFIDVLEDGIRTQTGYSETISISNRYANGYYRVVNPATGLTERYLMSLGLTESQYFDNFLSGLMMTLFRSLNNELYLISYVKVDRIAVAVSKVVKIVNDLSIFGYEKEQGMRIVASMKDSTASSIYELTKPYDVTFEELTTFETDQSLEVNTIVRLTDISGYNTNVK